MRVSFPSLTSIHTPAQELFRHKLLAFLQHEVAGEMDVAMGEFDAALAREMARFDELNR